MPLLQYANRVQAQQYFDGRLGTQAWDSATATDQDKSLAQATTLIDRLDFAGEKVDPAQQLQFPRRATQSSFQPVDLGILLINQPPPAPAPADASVPQDVVNACAEIALKLLEGVDLDREGRSLSIVEQNFATVKVKSASDFVPEWILAGIPSMTAWNFLRPYLNDPLAVSLSRVN